MKSRIDSSVVVGSPIAVEPLGQDPVESGSESTSTPSQSKITRSYAIGRRTLEAVRSLTDPWELGGIRIPNRVVLAPLAGIGNWFVRLQAKRYGAGLAFSEMVSSFAIHYENRARSTSCCDRPARARAAGRWRCSCSARTRTSCAPPPRAWPRRAPT